MLPGLFRNASHMYDCMSRVLQHYGGTVQVKGPWCTGMNFFFTRMLPGLFRNASHMYDCMSRVLQHYGGTIQVKGPWCTGMNFFFTNWWAYQRKMMHSIMKNSKFELFLMKVVQQKVVAGLIPLLNYISKSNIEVDLQEVFKRFTFDNSCLMVLGFDPISLLVEFPKRTYEKAFDEIEEAILYRHIVPNWCWKLQRCL
ncbi:alkane hydroxylase mah1 [Quercus suber]|uniref:Alkane hydroxylase mah1 n=1 Tax=Quercus suber TaxID=58331 RepID=A0AAW0J9F2_QUESU